LIDDVGLSVGDVDAVDRSLDSGSERPEEKGELISSSSCSRSMSMGPRRPSRYFIDEGGLSVGDVAAVDRGEDESSELPAEDDELSVPDEEDDPGVDEAKCP